MDRPKAVEEAISGLDGFDEVSWYREWWSTVYSYIEKLERMVDISEKAIHHAIQELDETIARDNIDII